MRQGPVGLLTCYTAQYPVSICDHWARAIVALRRILRDPTPICSRTRTVRPTNSSSWFDFSGSAREKKSKRIHLERERRLFSFSLRREKKLSPFSFVIQQQPSGLSSLSEECRRLTSSGSGTWFVAPTSNIRLEVLRPIYITKRVFSSFFLHPSFFLEVCLGQALASILHSTHYFTHDSFSPQTESMHGWKSSQRLSKRFLFEVKRELFFVVHAEWESEWVRTRVRVGKKFLISFLVVSFVFSFCPSQRNNFSPLSHPHTWESNGWKNKYVQPSHGKRRICNKSPRLSHPFALPSLLGWVFLLNRATAGRRPLLLLSAPGRR